MARLGLKLLYLRTRLRKISQQQLAKDLGVRQATLSHIERGRALPGVPLLLQLCRYFDVTPTWFLDDDSGVEVSSVDRWSMRRGLLTTGMCVEVSEDEAERLADGKLLVTLPEDAPFYDEEAVALRKSAASETEARERLEKLGRERAEEEVQQLAKLEAELTIHPRRRARARRESD